MTQLLHTGRYGTIKVEKSWFYENTHICKLADGGGYVYVTGLPVTSEGDLKKVIPAGPDRDEALAWFHQKDNPPEKPTKRIIINPDGSCVFEDGSPVENVSDILAYIPPGPFQDAAYRWLQDKLARQREMETKMAKATGRAAMKVSAKGKSPQAKAETKPETANETVN